MVLSKSDYLLYRECKKSAWLKKHKPELYYSHTLTPFEKMIVETGNEVELVARELFPTGILIEGRDEASQELTLKLIREKQPVLFQAVFENDGFLAAVDVLEVNQDTGNYTIYEIKSTNDIDEKTHYYDLAFQVNLLRKCGIIIEKICLIHLDKDYVRIGSLNPTSLFKVEDVTEKIESLCEEVSNEMINALEYISQDTLPEGYCACVYKGRSKHCACFATINTDIPEYGIHDIARIGSSKKKLEELVDSRIFNINDVPVHIKLSAIQQNQVDAYKSDKAILDKESLKHELEELQFPLYFIDYETLPCAIPRFDRFSPYQHIPFQFSLYVLDTPDSEPRLLNFLHSELDDPSAYFAQALKSHIGESGNIIVWNKSFECGRNSEIALRIPEMYEFVESLNGRVFDLEEFFTKQYYVHPGFKGRTSIKNILPVMVPELSYKELSISDGGAAAEIWHKLTTQELSSNEKDEILLNLKKYCDLDAYAMYAIWKELNLLIN